VDQLSFAYLQMARITQDDTGVLASMETEDGPARVYLPTAAIASLLLGPGVSITQPAISTLARHGTSIVFVGEHGVRCYSSISGPRSADMLLLAAKVTTDPDLRLAAARRMYAIRFQEDIPATYTLDQLRGLEGARMRATYAALAKRHQIAFRRDYKRNDFESADPVNQALSSANTCLYGIVGAVLASLGIAPGLGIVHSGTSEALIYDIADMYKTEITIPLAFLCVNEGQPATAVRRKLRERLTLARLMPRIVQDIRHVYGLAKKAEPGDLRDVEVTSLWAGGDAAVPGGVNYSDGDHPMPAAPTGPEDW